MTIREQWREAAQRDQLQFYGMFDPFDHTRQIKGGNNRPAQIGDHVQHCAMTLINACLDGPRLPIVRTLECPACGMTKEWASPSDLMIHLNNVHRWDWLDLANKFPPVLPEDQP